MTPGYLAGFFDGEGCIDCQKMYPKQGKGRVYIRPRIRISQTATCRIVLDNLQAEFGGYIYYRQHTKGNQRDSVSWEILNADGIARLLAMALPYLIVEAEQAKLVLWWFENAYGLQQRKNIRPNLGIARRAFEEELKAMKRDPTRLSSDATMVIGKLLI